jgi:hypothetical protein
VQRDFPVTLGKVVELDETGGDPLAVRMLGGETALDLRIVDDPAFGRVHQEHLARFQSSLADDRGLVDLQHTDLAGEHDQAVFGDPVARRAEPVAVEDRSDLRAVGERNQRGTVPRLHQRGVELVERPPLGVHLLMIFPGLRDHHQHRVRQ